MQSNHGQIGQSKGLEVEQRPSSSGLQCLGCFCITSLIECAVTSAHSAAAAHFSTSRDRLILLSYRTFNVSTVSSNPAACYSVPRLATPSHEQSRRRRPVFPSLAVRQAQGPWQLSRTFAPASSTAVLAATLSTTKMSWQTASVKPSPTC